MGITTLDELNGMLEGHMNGRGKQKMYVFRHHYERVNLKPAFAAISVHGLKEESDVILDDEQSSSLPGFERYEIGARRGDESCRLQEQTSAAKAAIFA